MAELADAYDSGSYRSNSVEVQVLLPAPKRVGNAYSFFFPKQHDKQRPHQMMVRPLLMFLYVPF